jgi:hypothetical protein
MDTAENPSVRHRCTNEHRPQHKLLETMGGYFLKGFSLTLSFHTLIMLLRLSSLQKYIWIPFTLELEEMLAHNACLEDHTISTLHLEIDTSDLNYHIEYNPMNI